jgi:hypothetical protein
VDLPSKTAVATNKGKPLIAIPPWRAWCFD